MLDRYIIESDLNDVFLSALQDLSNIARGRGSTNPMERAATINYFTSLGIQNPVELGTGITPTMLGYLGKVVQANGLRARATNDPQYKEAVNSLNRTLFEPLMNMSLTDGGGALSASGRINLPNPAPQTSGAQTSGASAGGERSTAPSKSSEYAKVSLPENPYGEGPPERDNPYGKGPPERENPYGDVPDGQGSQSGGATSTKSGGENAAGGARSEQAEPSAGSPGSGPVEMGAGRAGLGPVEMGAGGAGLGGDGAVAEGPLPEPPPEAEGPLPELPPEAEGPLPEPPPGEGI